MVERRGGFRRKTRHKLRRNKFLRGKLSLRRYFQSFEPGNKVVLSAESNVQKGMYFPAFHGLIGIVQEKQGKCYKVLISDKGKEKILIVHPVHLKNIEQK